MGGYRSLAGCLSPVTRAGRPDLLCACGCCCLAPGLSAWTVPGSAAAVPAVVLSASLVFAWLGAHHSVLRLLPRSLSLPGLRGVWDQCPKSSPVPRSQDSVSGARSYFESPVLHPWMPETPVSPLSMSNLALSWFPVSSVRPWPLLGVCVQLSVSSGAHSCLQLCIRSQHLNLGFCGFTLPSLGVNNPGSETVPSADLLGPSGCLLPCP